MATLSIDDAKRFLDLHPWATSDIDNPVELLREVVKDFHSDLEAKLEEAGVNEDDEDDEDTGDVAQKLCAFIKGLRDDLKISEAEYQTAMALAKVQ